MYVFNSQLNIHITYFKKAITTFVQHTCVYVCMHQKNSLQHGRTMTDTHNLFCCVTYECVLKNWHEGKNFNDTTCYECHFIIIII